MNSEAAPSETPPTLGAAVPIVDPAPTTLHLSESLSRQLACWGDGTYPFEACGLLIGRADGDRVRVEKVVQARNLNTIRARDRYLLAPDDFLAADRMARAEGLEIVGIWHTHPDCPARPSPTDLEAAWEGYSYLILTMTATGCTEQRSWRLAGGGFQEEPISAEESR